MSVAEFLRSLAQAGHAVVVIEHDLIMLDAMSDSIHIMYGQENAYGVCSLPKATKTGINIYLDGFLKEENVRFRNSVISFNKGVAVQTLHTLPLCEWEAFDVHLPDFTLQVQKGMLHKRDVVGVLGENGIGKSSFVKALAGLQKTSKGLLDTGLRIGYKPQHLPKDDTLVGALLQQAKQKYDTLLIRPLQLDMLFDQHLTSLSGGQLQRVIVAAVLAKDVDLYLLDEPSAYLDVEQRLLVSKVIKDFMMHTGKTAIVVDHDLLFLDYLSDKLLVFEGTPGVTGKACGPFMMQEG
ncbi:MAG: ATP-binding cassette domain-containing protein, partial [Candidatus Woesearchaeota archaeon]